MTRVTLLTTNLAQGGAEIQVAALARLLHERGWEIRVISLLKPSALEEELKEEGIPVYSLDAGVSRVALGRLVPLLNRLRPQILHAHMFHANVAARLIRLLCPAPVVISTIHSWAETGRNLRTVRTRDWVYRITNPLVDRIVCVSEAVARRHITARAVSAQRVCVIPNGVDTSRFRPDLVRRERTRAALGLGNEFVWLAAGRLMWKKNYPLMLNAAARVPECRLLIAGGGPDELELKNLAARLGVHARFLGPRNDMPDLMNACDGFVLSSAVEGLPLVLLEAAASGLPQVAVRVGGVEEILLSERTGFLVEPADPEALAMGMARLAALPAAERAAFSNAARAHALSQFDLQTVAARWEQLYVELLRSAQRRNGEE
jgi:glycosyltransferase involved in cell wall biosynthesis